MKVDGRYYREVLVKKQMLPVMRHIADEMENRDGESSGVATEVDEC